MAEDESGSESQIAEMRKRQAEAYQKELQLREILRKILDDKAFERISNIRLANRQLYLQLAQMLVYAYQQGQFQGKITEQMLLSLLSRLKAGEREPTISVKRK